MRKVKPYGWRADLEAAALEILREGPMPSKKVGQALKDRYGATPTEWNAVYAQLLLDRKIKGSIGGKLSLR
jgi:hypothetical protein